MTSQYDLFDEYSIDSEMHQKIFDYARSKSLDIFSSPSHVSDVNMLETLNCDSYKIGSDDAVNIPLLKYIAKLNKPIVLATGMCTLDEVKESVNAILEEGNSKISILHAITSYPTHPKDVNLRAIHTLKDAFPLFPIGYSDHTLGIEACLFAVAMGARIIEKHFTYDKNAPGPDHIHSADPEEMKRLVDSIRLYEEMAGTGIKMPAESEKITRVNNRKSIVLCTDLKKGDVIGQGDIDIKRPGTGIAPKYIDQVIGCVVNKDLENDTVLNWTDIS